MSEPICECGHGKAWHRDPGGACIHPVGVRDRANDYDCDCKGYALPDFPPTLRDQFAMAALTGLLSTASTLVFRDSDGKIIDQHRRCKAVALEAYRTADEMLAAREKLTA